MIRFTIYNKYLFFKLIIQVCEILKLFFKYIRMTILLIHIETNNLVNSCVGIYIYIASKHVIIKINKNFIDNKVKNTKLY